MDKHDLFQQFVAFTTTLHEMTHTLTQHVKLDQITTLQYKILEYIQVSQAVTATEISDCLHMSLPNTSRELRKLQEKKLIDKIGDPEDRRKQVIRLTPTGQKLMDEAFSCIEEQFLQFIQHASPQDVAAISQALTVLEQHFFSARKY
ncbi:MarR family winged helix-turn-helix transcriptional regulator [Lysinibacillus piscis]|uniref:HTH marR-type domain-containing protein n=1 Tax=Lysinibacillus piscis TaxID=2518931 RepID=A0ABQ5NF54_9BACI|nr:MarR family winged helix-turn-helix transcriptional regulator [Lysinibacillus sp. KH24]GLC87026.1 hypothetical protein LYSBPC_01530 [Lysinibacillus sp. KH24]